MDETKITGAEDNKKESIPVDLEAIEGSQEVSVETAEDLTNLSESTVSSAADDLENMKNNGEKTLASVEDTVGLSGGQVEEIKGSNGVEDSLGEINKIGEQHLAELKLKISQETGGIDKREPTEEKSADIESGKLRTSAEIAMEKAEKMIASEESNNNSQLETEQTLAEKNQEEINNKFSGNKSTVETTYPTAEARQAHINSQESDLEKATREADEAGTAEEKPDLTTAEGRQKYIDAQESDLEKATREADEAGTAEEKPDLTTAEGRQKYIDAQESDLEKATREADKVGTAEEKPDLTTAEGRQKYIDAQESDLEKATREADKVGTAEEKPENIMPKEENSNDPQKEKIVEESKREKNAEKGPSFNERISQISSESELFDFIDNDPSIKDSRREDISTRTKWAIGMLEKTGYQGEKTIKNILSYLPRHEAFRIKVVEIYEQNSEKLEEDNDTEEKPEKSEKSNSENNSEKSLRDIGAERRQALMVMGKSKWESLKSSIASGKDKITQKIVSATDHVFAAPEAISRGAAKVKEGGIDAAVATKEKIADGVEAIQNKALEKYNALEERGKKAYENMAASLVSSKNQFRDFINQKRIERLNRKEGKKQEKLDRLMREKINPLKSRIDEIRAKKAIILSKMSK